MSIEVKEVTKRYGDQIAVDRVSFTVNSGEIVGFIGPNGAGKSTTMKIITGTIVPDSGKVMIGGKPALENLKAIRRSMGVLPEHNPLYLEMFILEYLDYVAGLYGIRGVKKKARIAEVVEMTGLGPEVHKKIVNLSKGYRQRVGLAQTLIHDPEILILDEPTTGLDPNQLGEIRSLISAIGQEKTVLLSTHILQEVEAICHRVIIINQGRIVADERSDRIREHGRSTVQTIHVELDSEADPAIWRKLSFIRDVKSLGKHQFLLESQASGDIRGDIFNFAVNQELTILSLTRKEKKLEEVFREITGA
jgi:ABC-2 type transport system ATP-binding protein